MLSRPFGEFAVVPSLPEFFRRYPEVQLDMFVPERSANLIEDAIDVAIRNGEMAGSSLVAKKIGTTDTVVVASPEYLAKHGKPKKPSDLEKHACIVFVAQSGPRSWTFAGRNGTVSYPADGSLRTNDGQLIRAAVLAHMGAAQVPHWLFAEDLKEGRVTRILRKYEPGTISISAVRPANRRLATKVTVFIDHLAKVLARGAAR